MKAAGTRRCGETRGNERDAGLNVIHLFLFGALIDQLLKADGIGSLVESGLQFFPGRAQFGRALGVAQRGRIEDLPMNRAKHVTQCDVGWRASQQVAAFFAAQAFHDFLRFELDQNLYEVIGRNVLRGGKFLDLLGHSGLMMSRERDHGARGIVAFHREFHAP